MSTDAQAPKMTFVMDEEVPSILPAGYIKNKEGIFYLEKKKDKKTGEEIETKTAISYTIFEITEQLENPDTGEVSLKVRINGKDLIFPAKELASKKGVLALAAVGVKTEETCASHMCKYINGVRALNIIPTTEIYSQMGWKPDGSFVLGERKFTINGIVPCRLSAMGKESKAINSSGNIEGWVKAVDGLLEYNPQRFKIYNGVKAPILYILNVQNHMLNDSGATSIGKTITSMCTTSMYGDPDEQMLAGGSTQTAAEELAAQLCDLPIHIDDTQKINKEDLDKIVYMIGNGVGKARGAKNGGMRNTNRFRTVALFTGEDRIIKDNSFDGMDMRLLEVQGGLRNTDVDAIHSFKGVENNHGVFGPVLIEWLVAHRDEVLEMHKESIATIKGAVEGDDVMNQNIVAVQDRLVGIYAPILTAGKIFEQIYKSVGGTEKDPVPIVTEAFNVALKERAGESYTLRGARYIHSWIAANQSYFLDDGCFNQDGEGNARLYRVIGNIKKTKYVIIPSELKQALKDKFSPERLMDDFKKEGLLIVGKGSKHTLSSKINEKVIKAYVLDKLKFDIFAGVEKDEDDE